MTEPLAPSATLPDADSTSVEVWPPPGRVSTPIRGILSMVAMDTRVSIKKILSDSVEPDIDVARAAAIWLAHEAGHDLAAIGLAFGGRDPADIEFMLSRAARAVIEDPHFAGWMSTYAFVLSMPAENP